MRLVKDFDLMDINGVTSYSGINGYKRGITDYGVLQVIMVLMILLVLVILMCYWL